jgi:urease accessory protein
MTRILNWLIAIALTLVPAVASAHVEVGDTNGFAHGFFHPLSGLDHILAIVAVGLFAARLGGSALWLVPVTFVSVVAVAGVLGMAGVELPYVEIGIGISVVVLGIAIALQLNISTLAAVGLVGFFAIFHGHAHGVEMPESVSGFVYGVGFAGATALLLAVGIGLGLTIGYAGQTFNPRIVQVGDG